MLIFRKNFQEIHQISTTIRISRRKDGAKDCINGYVTVTYRCSNSVNIPKAKRIEAGSTTQYMFAMFGVISDYIDETIKYQRENSGTSLVGLNRIRTQIIMIRTQIMTIRTQIMMIRTQIMISTQIMMIRTQIIMIRTQIMMIRIQIMIRMLMAMMTTYEHNVASSTCN